MAGRRGRPPKSRRPDRTPLATHRQKLRLNFRDPDFEKQYFWYIFNDEGDRLTRALDAGYEFIRKDEIVSIGDDDVHSGDTDLNSRVSLVVTRASGGDPEIRGYPMKLPMELRREDEAAKEKQNSLVDEGIRGGKPGGTDVENRYGGITFPDR